MKRLAILGWILVLLGAVPAAATQAAEDEKAEDERHASSSLARLIGRDFKNAFTTRENIVIVGIGAGAALASSPFDTSIATGTFNSEVSGQPALDAIFEAGEIGGDGYVQIGTALTTFGFGKLFGATEMTALGRDLIRAQVLTGAVTIGIKEIANRRRPDGSSRTSFPSGHTSSSFATATVLQRRYGWRVGIPAYAFAGYVAGSRMNEGRHFLSDVLFGAALGIFGGRTVTVGLGERRFEVSPLIVSGGGGIQLTWRGGGP